MSSKLHERTYARQSTVQVLYTSEIQNELPSVLLKSGRCLSEEGPLSDYALMLIQGVEDHRAEIDQLLASSSDNWSVNRMPIVDRAILRLAVYEMMHVDDVPVSVSINEAVELAKSFGGEDDSSRFVNGVLGRIARQLEEDEATEQAAAEIADKSIKSADGIYDSIDEVKGDLGVDA